MIFHINHDARAVKAAIQAYFSDHYAWPPAGPVDKTSVLLMSGPNGPYLRAAPSNDKCSINTDGGGNVLVAVPRAPSGGIDYDEPGMPAMPSVRTDQLDTGFDPAGLCLDETRQTPTDRLREPCSDWAMCDLSADGRAFSSADRRSMSSVSGDVASDVAGGRPYFHPYFLRNGAGFA